MGDITQAEISSSRPTPVASGTLAKTPLVNLLLYAADKKLSGTMEFFAPDKRSVVVLFAGGEPLKVRTSEGMFFLGEVLRDLGHIREDQLTRSMDELAKRKLIAPKLHGSLLLEMGFIDLPKLRAGLAEQIGRKLRHLASMPRETAFAYFEGFDSLNGWGGGDSVPVDSFHHLWNILGEQPPLDHIGTALTRVAGSALRLAKAADLSRLRLPKEQADAVELLRQHAIRPRDFAKTSALEEPTAQMLAYLLIVTRQVEIVAAKDSKPPGTRSSRPPMSAARKHPSSPDQRSSQFPPPSARRSATPPPMERPSQLPPKSKRQSQIPPPPDLSPENADRWKEISDRARTIERADYFMMLDLARDATKEDVESAFLAMAKRWHPDRLPAELAPVRDDCSRVFARMSEARSTLVDPEQRAKYMRLLSDGSGSPEMQDQLAKVVDAVQNFQKAEVFFKRNDLAQAEMYCRKAFEGDDTQPDYLALLAWIESQKPENQAAEKTAESLKMLDKAIAMSARCEKAFYWRAMLYKRIGRGDLATRDFRRVAELNPRNIDAAREVRLQQMRSGKSVPPPAVAAKSDDAAHKSGLLGRIFKKP